MAAANPHFQAPGNTQRFFTPPPGKAPTGQTPQAVPPQPPPPAPPMSSPTKEVNTTLLCRIGQETVHDIVQKTLEIFQNLKTIQIPNGVSVTSQVFQDRKAKLDEHVKSVAVLFKKLRLLYDKMVENCAALETGPAEEMLPLIENGEVKGEKPVDSEVLKYRKEEHKEMVEQVQMKNQQLKEIIDQLRTIVWEINAMMAMRRT